MLGLSGTSSYAVFVFLCICVFCIFVFARSAHGIIIFNILEQSSFQKYTTCWVFLALRHMLYLCILCICIFVQSNPSDPTWAALISPATSDPRWATTHWDNSPSSSILAQNFSKFSAPPRITEKDKSLSKSYSAPF